MLVMMMMMMMTVRARLVKKKNEMCWEQLFGKNPLQVLWGIGGVCHAGVLVVSQLCFGGRWCLVAFWWCVRGCLGGVR